MGSSTLRYSEADAATIKLLDSKARALEGAKLCIESGLCRERAEAALDEAVAILRDAVRNCQMLPNVVGPREE